MPRVVLALLLTLAFPAAASARSGDVDAAYAAGGRAAFTVGVASAHVAGLVARPDGSAVITGTAVTQDGGSATSVSQLTPDGALDPAFGTGGTALVDPVPTPGAQPAGAALNPDGSLIVATTILDPSTGELQVHVVRVLPDGSLDTSFGNGGLAVLMARNGDVTGEDVAIDPVGRILVAASVDSRGKRVMSAFRLSPVGHRDPTFAGGRVDLDNQATAGAILPRPGGGAILAGRIRSSYGNVVTAAVDDFGELIDTFGGSGRSHTRLTNYGGGGSGPVDMVFGPNRSMIVAANVHSKGLRSRLAVFRLSRNGYLERRWANHGTFTAGSYRRPFTVAAMVRDARGRLLLTGSSHTPSTGAQDALAMRLTASGHADRRFGSGGHAIRHLGAAPDTRFVDSYGTAVAVTPGRVLVGGVAFDDVVDPITDLGRAWPVVMRLYNR